MKWFYNLSITNKITFILGILTIMLMIIFGVSYDDFQSIQVNQRKVTDQNYQAVTELTKLTNDINNLRIQILSAMVNPKTEANKQILRDVVTKIGELKNSAVLLHGVKCIVYQIHKYMLKLIKIGFDRWKIRS